MSVTNHKCPNCNAGLPFNAKKGLWVCEYCHSEFTEEQLNEYMKKENDEASNKKSKTKKTETDEFNMDIYRCPSCGAQIIADENTTATFCVYCKNPAIIKEKFKGEFNPDYILPFSKTKNDAINAFKHFSKGKIFTPNDFTNPKNISEITPIYIPFWTYSCSTDGSIDVDARKVTHWRSGNYNYTKTDYYDVRRSGTVDFDKVPADGSTKFDDNIMDSIEPYDYSALKDFNMSYLSGFFSENYDVSKEETFKRVETRINQTAIDKLSSDIVGYSSKFVKDSNININGLDTKYVLLPVWMLNTKYNDKIYTFAMNGQTGKIVGNIPIDKTKLFIKTSLFFLASVVITTILSFLN